MGRLEGFIDRVSEDAISVDIEKAFLWCVLWKSRTFPA